MIFFLLFFITKHWEVWPSSVPCDILPRPMFGKGFISTFRCLLCLGGGITSVMVWPAWRWDLSLEWPPGETNSSLAFVINRWLENDFFIWIFIILWYDIYFQNFFLPFCVWIKKKNIFVKLFGPTLWVNIVRADGLVHIIVPPLLTWINLNPSMPVKCGKKLLTHSQISVVQ